MTIKEEALTTPAGNGNGGDESFYAHFLSLHCIALWVVVVCFLVAREARQEEEKEKVEEEEEEENSSTFAAAAHEAGGGWPRQKMLQETSGRTQRLLQGRARAKRWATERKKKKNSHLQAEQKESRNSNWHLKKLQEVITFGAKAMQSADTHGVFLNPVTDTIAPGYSAVIREPMCIRAIEDKAAEMKYRHLSELEHDVHLMFDNCIKYNNCKEGKWFQKEAKRQREVWENEIMPQVRDLHYKKGLW